MAFWIFTTTNQKHSGGVLSAREIYKHRMADKFWGLGERTPNRRTLKATDSIVFYVGQPECTFTGTAVLATESFMLSKEHRQLYWHDNPIFHTEYGVQLRDINVWESPVPVRDLVNSLFFIENKEFWGTYFQGGIRGLTEEDYRVIAEHERKVFTPPTIDQQPRSDDDSRFALESHLEEFLDINWHQIAWCRSLARYQTDESNGRQFPAGTWSIDFLVTERKTNDLVVIELKRGQTSDATVGQVLRYMGWVRENIATEGQKVKGVIICRNIDDALKYAVKNLSDITVLTYQVTFALNEVEK